MFAVLSASNARGQDQNSAKTQSAGQSADNSNAQAPPADQNAGNQQDEITAVPNRPTVASTAESVQSGVFEIEYGFELASGHQNVNGLLKWGVLKNLELWFLNVPIERDSAIAGRGDSGAGFKYRFFSQSRALPSTAVLYVAALPTATANLGAGAL